MNVLRSLALISSAVFLTANASDETFYADNYTILPALHLDLDRMVVHQFVDGSMRTSRIESCSTQDAYCLRSSCGPDDDPRVTPPDCKPGDDFAMIWPRACVRHYEIGDTLEAGGIKGTVIGTFQSVIHHTGMRNSELVIAIEGKPDIALLVSRSRLRGVLIDTLKEGQIAKRFSVDPVLDAEDIASGEYPGLIASIPTPSAIIGSCTS